jgi:hypothetical protein
MTDQRWGRAKALFQAAVERPPAERATFVAVQAADHDEPRREVEALLESDAADRSVLERARVFQSFRASGSQSRA